MNVIDQIQRVIFGLAKRIASLEERTSNLPSRWARSGDVPALRVLISQAPSAKDPPIATVSQLQQDNSGAGSPFSAVMVNAHQTSDIIFVERIANGTGEKDDDGNDVYWRETTPKLQVVAKLSAEEGRYGCYTAHVVAILTGFDATTLSASFQPAVIVGSEVVFCHLDESDLNTHWLAPNSYVIGEINGLEEPDDPDATPRPLMLGFGISYKNAIGKTLNATSLTADATTWSRATTGDNALSLTIASRPAYWDNSAGILYGFTRVLQFDAGGRLFSAGDESRAIIDPPTDCSS